MSDTNETTDTETEEKIEFYCTEGLKHTARVRMAQRGYGSLSAYMRGLIEEDAQESGA